MPSEPTADARPHSPVWFRRPEVLHRWTYVVIGLATLVEFVVVAFRTEPAMTLPGLVVTVAGAALAGRWPWPG